MKVEPVQPTAFTGIRINAAENKHVKYLYNHLLDVTNKHKIGGTFATNYVKLNSESNAIIEFLNNLKIIFKIEK